MYFLIKRLNSYGVTTKIIALLTVLAFLSTVTEIIGIGMFIPIFDFIQGGVDSYNLDREKSEGVIGYIENLLVFFDIEITFESLIIFTFLLFLISKTIAYIITYTSSYYTGVITRDMRRKLLNLYLRSSSEYYDRVKIGDFTNVSFVELNNAIGGVLMPIKLVISITYIFVSILFLLLLSYKLTLLSAVVLFVSILYPSRWIRAVKKAGSKNSNFNSVITSFLLERLRSPRLVRLSSAAGLELETYNSITEKQRRLTLNVHILKARVKLVTEPLVVGISLIMIYLAVTVIGMNPGEVLLYLIITIRLVPSVDALVSQIMNMNSSEGAIKMIEDLTKEMKEDIKKDNFQIYEKLKFMKNIEFIELSDISYKYNNKYRNIVDNISVTFYTHTISAIVGPSGSGKSTLVDIISKYRKPTSGNIFINGIELSQYDGHQLNSLVSYMPQEPQIFDGTVKSHISYGSKDEQIDKIIKYSKLSGAFSFIKNLEQGFDSLIREGGSNLSGGQKKRLDLTRALYLDSPVLILDEPTSGLDQVSSKKFMETIEYIKKNIRVSVVIITHDLNLLKDVDQIIVFEDGKITGKGKHKQLKGSNKWYSEAINKL